MTCDRCQQTVTVGEWPWCPHGVPNVGVIDDQLEGGPRRFETLGDDAPYIDSKSALKREVQMRNLVPVGDRKPADYFARHRKMQDECVRDTGKTLDGHTVRER